MRLYKYLPPERVDVLQRSTIRFTQPADFNDPFELRPNIAAFVPPEQLRTYLRQFAPHAKKAFRSGLSERVGAAGLPERLSEPVATAFQPLVGELFVSMMEQTIPAALERNRVSYSAHVQATAGDKIGILSLSEVETSLLMWAHYAAAHQGFVLEFDSDHTFFNQPAKHPHEVFRRLHPMTYSVERPAITLYDPQADWVAWGQAFAKQAFLTKSPEWAYEREWRMFLPLDDLETHPHETNGRVHLFPYPADAVAAVIVGARSRAQTRTDIEAALRTEPKLRHVDLRDALVSATRFEVTTHAAVGAGSPPRSAR